MTRRLRGGRLAAAALAVATAGRAALAADAAAATPEPTGRIAYLAVADGTWQVWLTDARGAQVRQLTRSPGDKLRVSWMPDGRALLVSAHGGRLLRVDRATGVEEPVPLPVPDVQDAVVSPRGDRVAFAYSPTGVRDDEAIWTLALDGKDLRRLTSLPGIQHQPFWSPDGRWLYFASGDGGQSHDLWRVAADGSRREQLTVGALYNFDPAVAADGSLAFSSNRTGEYEIWVRPPQGEPRRLTHEPGIDASPAWSPDGRWIVFESSRGGPLDLWRIPATGGAAWRLTSSTGGARRPAWSPVPGDTP